MASSRMWTDFAETSKVCAAGRHQRLTTDTVRRIASDSSLQRIAEDPAEIMMTIYLSL